MHSLRSVFQGFFVLFCFFVFLFFFFFFFFSVIFFLFLCFFVFLFFFFWFVLSRSLRLLLSLSCYQLGDYDDCSCPGGFPSHSAQGPPIALGEHKRTLKACRFLLEGQHRALFQRGILKDQCSQQPVLQVFRLKPEDGCKIQNTDI